MVRFIIKEHLVNGNFEINLHSNMVRFIINIKDDNLYTLKEFTFQYG